MPTQIEHLAEWMAALLEMLGIAVIVVIAAYALVHGIRKLLSRVPTDEVFQELRQNIGRGILLGLELLIAADIIHTVAVDLTFEALGVLAVVVLIRTFLSFTLEVELTGKWPWQEHKGD